MNLNPQNINYSKQVMDAGSLPFLSSLFLQNLETS